MRAGILAARGRLAGCPASIATKRSPGPTCCGFPRYQVDLDLSAARDSGQFGSTTTVRFSCAVPGSSTFAELRPVSILEARLNGVPLAPAALADGRLRLTDLRAENELVVRATMAYSNTGEGLHRFADPADGEVYLYAQVRAGQRAAHLRLLRPARPEGAGRR